MVEQREIDVNLFAPALVLFTGIALCALGILAMVRPALARAFLGGFASSPQTHVLEQAIRIAVGAALVIHAPNMAYSTAFTGFGWLLIGTSVGLLCVPWRWHRRFAQATVPPVLRLLPVYAFFQFVLGAVLVLSVVRAPAAVEVEAPPVEQMRVESGLLPGVRVEGDDHSEFTLPLRRAVYGVPAVSVAVARDGELHWAAGYGDGVGSETLFQAASLSKAVAAAGIVTLAREKGVDLDADITSQIPGVDLASKKTEEVRVTLRGLLSHTAGATVSGFPGYAVGADLPTNLELIGGSPRTNTPRITIDPGAAGAFRYSGGGYQIAQAWAEEVSGEGFAALMDRLVLAPLGMQSSSFVQPPSAEMVLTRSIAPGFRGDGPPIAGGWHVYPEQAAAGLWTTASDYLRFLIALMRASNGSTDTGLDPAVARELVTPVSADYGLGVGIESVEGKTRWGHSGSNAGYRSIMAAFPERGDAIVVLTNKPQGFPLANEIMRGADLVYGWPAPPLRRVERFAMSTDALGEFTGTFALEGTTAPRLEITVDGRELEGTQVSGPTFRLIPISSTTFIDPEDGTEVEFSSDDGRLIAETGGRRFVRTPQSGTSSQDD